ncbi:type II toxin-antitoxin system YhaV family toxin [Legionella sp. PATHC035]
MAYFLGTIKQSKIIIYAWVNDDSTKRADDNKADTHYIFQKMLKN